ncbi:MAG: V-type ATP synthase subunit E family protein [Candidatus Auribacterota bacterium]|jgi:vacuolar-type H+-ATPase subunit E/Vma4|nr:V-type ATP synthase subunit E family protein [Candidatus Auribacterota bacterium]
MEEQSVEILCGQILDEAKKEAESILKKAKMLAEQRVKITEQQADSEAKKILAKAQEESEQARKKILSSLNLEEHKRRLQKQESLILTIIDQVDKELIKFSQTSDYDKFLKQSAVEALSQLHAKKPVTLTFGKDDPKARLNSIVKDIERSLPPGERVSLRIDSATHDQHGVVASIDNGLIRINNTLEERLRSQIDQVRAYIHENLFEKGAAQHG